MSVSARGRWIVASWLALLGASEAAAAEEAPHPPDHGSPPVCPGDLVLAQWMEVESIYSAEGCRRLNGARQGRFVVWDPQRERLLVQGQYTEGERVGTWKVWSFDGKLRQQKVYEDGVVVHVTHFYPAGTKRSETRFDPRSRLVVRGAHWGENGQLMHERECLEVRRRSPKCGRWRERDWAASGELFFDEASESYAELMQKRQPLEQRISEERRKALEAALE